MAVDEKTNEYDIRYRKSSVENRIAHTGYQDYMDMCFNGEKPIDFCEIQSLLGQLKRKEFSLTEKQTKQHQNLKQLYCF